MIQDHIKPALGKHHLAKLDHQHVQAMLNRIDVSAETARLIRSILRAALHQAMAWGQVGRNVAALTKPPKGERFEGYALSPDEVRAVMIAVTGDDLEALYAIATSVGGCGKVNCSGCVGAISIGRQARSMYDTSTPSTNRI